MIHIRPWTRRLMLWLRHDLVANFTLAAVSRSYYSMFYCMTGLLSLKDVHTKSHQGTKTKFSELYIKTGIFPLIVSDYLQSAFALRQEADYDMDATVGSEEVMLLLENAETFISLTKRYLDEVRVEYQS